jgi:hypothetical protein
MRLYYLLTQHCQFFQAKLKEPYLHRHQVLPLCLHYRLILPRPDYLHCPVIPDCHRHWARLQGRRFPTEW